MTNILLFIAVVVVWGLTWFAMHLQLGAGPVEIAIFWRFALSLVLLGGWLCLTGRLRRPSLECVPWLVAMGICLFSGNYLVLYRAAAYLPSGMVSVIFSLASVLNALNLWLFFRQRPDARIIGGGLLGVMGVALLLGEDHGGGTGSPAGSLTGIGLALAGTLFFSLGSMVTRRIGRFDLDLPNAVFYGMGTGTAIVGTVALTQGYSFAIPLTLAWLGGLAYLSVFGSVIGFLTYLSLVHRIGADRAGYTTILSPVLALAVSCLFEGTRWTPVMLAGLGLVLAGNVLAFVRRRPVPTPVEVEQA
ncbi:DMT family transporter [Acetobacter senegalensis]|uniref:DMT family transporter n=1 Tax=Acetobacter senegalensis TaxID=446692 RepID=UPI001EDC5F32|nr:DMT family transporter [Acetobacter senegalensis]MCG4262531.1 DMT family transporter [Acetobacter senegalensis]